MPSSWNRIKFEPEEDQEGTENVSGNGCMYLSLERPLMLNNNSQAWANEALANVKILTGLRKSGKESATEGLFQEKRLSVSISPAKMPEVMNLAIFLRPSDN